MAGWDELGRTIGRSGNTTDAYQRGQTKAAQLEGLISQARVKRAEADAIANAPGALVKLGLPADLATVLQAGWDPTKLSGYSGDMQEQGFRGDAASRALAGDWGGANAALMGVASGPQQLAKIESQNLLGNVFLEGGGGVTTTDQGRAGMAANAAQARASDASAANSYASAARTRQATGIDSAEFGMKRAGQWNPDGATKSAAAVGRALSAPTINKLTSDAEKAALLTNLSGSFQEDYAGNGMGGQFENIAGRLGWTGGMTGATPGQAEWWQQYDRNKNVIRNELFGAALTPSEQAEFDKADINPNMSPAIIKKNLATQHRVLEEGLRRQARVWAAQGYNQDALRAATGLEDFTPAPLPPAGDVFSGAAPTPGAVTVPRATNPATGQVLELRNGQWVPAR